MKKHLSIAALLLCFILLFGCGSKQEDEPISVTETILSSHTESTTIATQNCEMTEEYEYEWYDEDGDGELEKVQIVLIDEVMSEMSLDEILGDPVYADYFWENFDYRDYDEETILSYSELRQYVRENVDFDIDDDWCIDMLETPNSTCFKAVGYSEIWEDLVVVFRDSGATYLYYEVPSEEAWTFIEADSLGQYYNSYIKGNYECDELIPWDGN